MAEKGYFVFHLPLWLTRTMLYNMVNLIRHLPLLSDPLETDGVIFLADMIDVTASNKEFPDRRDLEKTTPQARDDVLGGLQEAGYRTHHLEHPSSLTNDLSWSRRHVVLSTYGGEVARSRTSWAPAICEAFGIPYVGLDAYGQSICHSKVAAKQLARQSGLKTPRAREYHAIEEIRHIDDWSYPVIVKPSAEGSSIGISQSSIIDSPEKLKTKAKDLLTALDASIMIEEFVTGREVSVAVIQGTIGAYSSFNEVIVEGEPDYFLDRVWDAHEKYHRELPRRVKSIDDELKDDDRRAIGRFLTALGDFGYIRIDGRLQDGCFHFLEATPDAWLGQGGQLAQGFVNDGWTYPEVLAAIIETARTRLPNPTATG